MVHRLLDSRSVGDSVAVQHGLVGWQHGPSFRLSCFRFLPLFARAYRFGRFLFFHPISRLHPAGHQDAVQPAGIAILLSGVRERHAAPRLQTDLPVAERTLPAHGIAPYTYIQGRRGQPGPPGIPAGLLRLCPSGNHRLIPLLSPLLSGDQAGAASLVPPISVRIYYS